MKQPHKRLLEGMRQTYVEGRNTMSWARNFLGSKANSLESTLIAYDLQAGTYIKWARETSKDRVAWGRSIANAIDRHTTDYKTILEVGVGEATTCAEVIPNLRRKPRKVLGFDISFSRVYLGQDHLKDRGIKAKLFVADLFKIPLSDSSIDVIYTSHSLEPNGGKEKRALKELYRVSKGLVVLFEPCYELANAKAKSRMRTHGYVQNLEGYAAEVGFEILEYKLIDDKLLNSLNPTGILILKKTPRKSKRLFKLDEPKQERKTLNSLEWQCPLSLKPLRDHKTFFFSSDSGLAYPVLRGIPVLCESNAIIASKIFDLEY